MERKFILSVEGGPGTRKSSFLEQLKVWIESQKHLSYKIIEEHKLEITYYEMRGGEISNTPN